MVHTGIGAGIGAGIGVLPAVATGRRIVDLSMPVAVDIESPAVVASR